jgi:hypothetical protein
MNNVDLIKQYLDTGLAIPEYQFNKLGNNLMGTYFRKRLIAVGQDDDDMLEPYELMGAPDMYKDIIVAALLKQMEPYYKEQYGREFDVESEEFYFMDGEMNPIIGKVLKYGKASADSDYYIFSFLANEKFLDYLNVTTMRRLFARSFDTQKVLKSMGVKGVKFLNSLSSETKSSIILYSSNPIARANIFGSEFVRYFRELPLKDIAYKLMHSANPIEFLELCGDECMDIYKSNFDLVRHALNNCTDVELLKHVFDKYGVSYKGIEIF